MADNSDGNPAVNAVEGTVRSHYTDWELLETIDRLLGEAGIEPASVTVDQLAALDHLHSFGIAGTLQLGRLLGITAGQSALDVGGGLGGPARLLASRYGCHVTVLDLTPEFCKVGATLTARTHLADRVSFVCGSALEMPFADGSFDLAWTQHASMNIADKPRLYAEIHRVLRPGGRFGFFDLMAGPNQPIHFPVPWATDAAYSFLLPPDEVRALIADAGFAQRTWMCGGELVATLQQVEQSASPPPIAGGSGQRLNTGMLMGPTGELRLGNAVRNAREGRTELCLGVFERL